MNTRSKMYLKEGKARFLKDANISQYQREFSQLQGGEQISAKVKCFSHWLRLPSLALRFSFFVTQTSTRFLHKQHTRLLILCQANDLQAQTMKVQTEKD
jgi:hypothetical protein